MGRVSKKYWLCSGLLALIIIAPLPNAGVLIPGNVAILFKESPKVPGVLRRTSFSRECGEKRFFSFKSCILVY